MSAHRIAYYGDIHYTGDRSTEYWTPPPNLDVEAIVLAGDIHISPEHLSNMLEAIRATQRDETMIIAVPGNGDYVNSEFLTTRAAYHAAVVPIPNAVFLDDALIELPSGLRFIGSVLWSEMSDEEIAKITAQLAALGHDGVDGIRIGERKMTFHDAVDFHRQSRAYIERELRSLSHADRLRTVVCTHYFPSLKAIDHNNPNEANWQSACASDMDAFITKYGPRLWICGHIHTSKDFMVGETRVISNPRAGEGVAGFNPRFLETAIVELT